MSALPKGLLALALGAAMTAASAGAQTAPPQTAPPTQATPQPPMNDFYEAFYRCDGGGAFNVSYNSDQPTKVELTANDGTKPLDLKRASSPAGFAFTAGSAKFWTDGKTVQVEGTKTALKNCKKAK